MTKEIFLDFLAPQLLLSVLQKKVSVCIVNGLAKKKTFLFDVFFFKFMSLGTFSPISEKPMVFFTII